MMANLDQIEDSNIFPTEPSTELPTEPLTELPTVLSTLEELRQLSIELAAGVAPKEELPTEPLTEVPTVLSTELPLIGDWLLDQSEPQIVYQLRFLLKFLMLT